MRKFVRAMCHPGAQSAIGSIMVLLLTIALVACGGDSGTSANEDDSSLSSWSEAIGSSSSKKGDAGKTSSSSAKTSSSSSQKIASSSSTPRNDVKSSSSKRSEGDSSSSSQKIASSSSSVKTASSSSSVIPASSGNLSSSSSKKVESSSSEYVPFDHSKTLAEDWRVGENRYKRFTDPRNGRSYYYIKIIGEKSSGRKDSVTIMAENLNIGEMVLGKDDQKDDTKIERYCYNNDTTKCDEFGGLYQWAEMMQLPSRCNTESCADLIQENHQGICPDGWRLMTYADFYIAWHAETNSYGIEGVRSAYLFNGYNSTGLSLTGAGLRTAEGGFSGLYEKTAWFRPEEYEEDKEIRAHHGLVSAKNESSPQKNHRELKTKGFSVRCVKLE